MTVQTLITKIRDEKPNSFSNERLIGFINEIEIEVAEQLAADTVPTYTSESMNETLLAPAPYDRLYVSYVKSQVDYANEELESYSNNAAQHVQDFRDFVDWIVRTDQAINKTTPAYFINVM